MDLGLKGKVAMVAGAGRGLGFAVAKALADEGAIVSIASRGERAIRLRRPGWAASLGRRHVRLADPIQHRADATIERFGGVDLPFANAGGPPAGPAVLR